MADISQIFFASSRFTIENRPHENDPLSVLKENEVIEAKVLKLLPGRAAQILIGGKSLTVKTHAPLSEGETIFLRFDPSGESPVLKLVSKADPVQQLNKALADNMDRAGPYRRLMKLIDVVNREIDRAEGRFFGAQGHTTRALSEGERVVGLVKSRSEKILDRIPSTERPEIDRFISTNRFSFREKLVALLHSSDGQRFFEEKKNRGGVLETGPEKIIANLTDEKKIRGGVKHPLTGREGDITPMEKRAELLLEVRIERAGTPTGGKGLPETKGGDLLIPEVRTKWSDQVLLLLSENSDFLMDENRMDQAIKTFIEALLQDSPPDEKKRAPILQAPLHLDTRERTASVPLKTSLGLSIRMISELVKEMALKSDIPDAQLVRGFIKKSGLSWENKLLSLVEHETGKALKGSVAELIESDLKGAGVAMLSKTDEKTDEALSLVRGFLESLEELQLINRYSGEAMGRYLVPFPVMWNEQIRFGQLMIDLGKENDKGKPLKDRVVTVRLLLELSNMGDVRADFSIYKKAVTGVFSVVDEEVRAIVKRELPGLEKRLVALGYKIYGIDCEVVSPERLAATTLTETLIDPDGNRMLSLMI